MRLSVRTHSSRCSSAPNGTCFRPILIGPVPIVICLVATPRSQKAQHHLDKFDGELDSLWTEIPIALNGCDSASVGVVDPLQGCGIC